MDRKIIFFDIDGTILTEDTKKIPQSAINAIKKARDNGHLAFINTGRTIFNIEKELHDIGFDGYVCGCGTYIQVKDTILFSTTINEKICKKLIDKLREYKIDAVLEGLEDVYFDSGIIRRKELIQIKEEFNQRGFGFKKDWDEKNLRFDKLFIITNEESNLDALKLILEEDFDYIDRGNGCGEIVPKGYSKATGIQRLLEYYHIDLKDAYAFGDSSNDYTMLKYVPNSVAMGKSDACILEIASFITKDLKEDGIAYALEQFHII